MQSVKHELCCTKALHIPPTASEEHLFTQSKATGYKLLYNLKVWFRQNWQKQLRYL